MQIRRFRLIAENKIVSVACDNPVRGVPEKGYCHKALCKVK